MDCYRRLADSGPERDGGRGRCAIPLVCAFGDVERGHDAVGHSGGDISGPGRQLRRADKHVVGTRNAMTVISTSVPCSFSFWSSIYTKAIGSRTRTKDEDESRMQGFTLL